MRIGFMSKIPDFSYLNCLLECPRKFYLRHVRPIEPKEGSILLKAGTAGHAALAEWYHPKSMYSLECALDALHAHYEDVVPAGRYDFLTLGHMEVILKNFHDYWLGRCPWDVVERIEEPLVAEIDGTEFGGIPDLMVEEHGDLLVCDHKFTTTYLGGHLYNRVKFSPQLRIYCVLATAFYKTPVRSGVINAIYMGDKASNPESKAQRFDRYRFDFTEDQIEETRKWLLEMNWRAMEIFSKQTLSPFDFPQHGGAHCGWCEYRELCEVSPALRDGIERSRFQPREVSGILSSGADS
jgi:hypothetical protein